MTGFKMSSIVHSWKSFTANKCNRVLGRTGRFWEREPFDRYIRNQRHFYNARIYTENNPVKAGLCEKPDQHAGSVRTDRSVLGGKRQHAGSVRTD